MRFIELFAGIGGFRYGLEEANQSCGEFRKRTRSPECSRPIWDSTDCKGKSWQGDKDYFKGLQGQQDSDQNISSPSISKQNRRSSRGYRAKSSFSCVWANELDKYACQIYRNHWGSKELYEGDIRTVDASTIPEHELLTAGFPCQSFSIAGKRGGFADIRGTLFNEICRIARAKRTPYLFLENVKGLLSSPYTETIQEWGEEDFNEDGEPTTTAIKKHKGITGTKGWVFLTILNTLWELGYDCQWQVLNSKDFGVPQNRERVFIVGHLRGQRRPEVFPIRESVEGFVEGTEQATSIRTLQGGGHSGGHHSGMTLVRARSDQKYSERGISTPLRQSDKAEVRMLTFKYGIMGEYNQKWLEDGKELSRNFPQGQRVYSIDGISAQINSQGVRRLTPIECERLQGFPDNWTKGISDTQRYKCLGNAVTVNVIEAIGRQWSNEVESDIEL